MIDVCRGLVEGFVSLQRSVLGLCHYSRLGKVEAGFGARGDRGRGDSVAATRAISFCIFRLRMALAFIAAAMMGEDRRPRQWR